MWSRPWLFIQFEDAARCGDNHDYTFNGRVPKDVEMWNDSYHAHRAFFFDLDSTLQLHGLTFTDSHTSISDIIFHFSISLYPIQSPSLLEFRWCPRICIIHHAMLAFPPHVLNIFSLSSKDMFLSQHFNIDFLQFPNDALA